MVKLGQYSRGVSIIGVGCTPFMFSVDNPDFVGITEGELFGYAALEAMEDAGIEAKDIDFYFHGQAIPMQGSGYLTPNIQIANWFGMKGKASLHHSEACATGYIAVEQAVNAVASGKYDIVLTGCCDMSDSIPVPGKPAHLRSKWDMKGFLEAVNCLGDRAYTRNMGAGPIILFDTWGELYCRENNLTDDQLDEALNAMAVSCRRAAARHPLALKRTEFSTEAKEAGFDDVMEYMRSSFNPKLSQHLRASGFETKCDGASALIVCPTEMAHQFRQKPVEVLGIGSSALESGTNTHLEKKITAESARQVYELTGVKPEEIDILYTADFFITSGLLSAEEVGYLPKGEGWKHVLEGRTAFDGDKPMNTNGGRCHFGHAHGTSGLADHWEAVKQLRGVCGDRQVKGDHRTAMLRGYGGGQNATAHILRIAD